MTMTMEISDVGEWAVSDEWYGPRHLTCLGKMVCFCYYYFLFFITDYHIQVLHDYDDGNKEYFTVPHLFWAESLESRQNPGAW